ncbi:hypothetical protein E4U43_000027 [Claviceps pusilla]|uniref:Uncharacterized protein n=1 Tax=Claviceps pusilla TaxID=123648 RepID=A0A9P7NCL5_9HYPO|nr:hypothetical protein E4U43_000027 [Claviceps pusilla]
MMGRLPCFGLSAAQVGTSMLRRGYRKLDTPGYLPTPRVTRNSDPWTSLAWERMTLTFFVALVLDMETKPCLTRTLLPNFFLFLVLEETLLQFRPDPMPHFTGNRYKPELQNSMHVMSTNNMFDLVEQ